MGLTNREELSFLTVLALPKASRMGLACSSCFSSSPCAQTHPSSDMWLQNNQSLWRRAPQRNIASYSHTNQLKQTHRWSVVWSPIPNNTGVSGPSPLNTHTLASHTRLTHFQHTTLTWNSIKILIKTIINFAVTKHKKATKTSTKIKVKPEISFK